MKSKKSKKNNKKGGEDDDEGRSSSWLSPENDEQHRKIVEPLLGTGAISLQDDPEKAASAAASGYGATDNEDNQSGSKAPPPPSREVAFSGPSEAAWRNYGDGTASTTTPPTLSKPRDNPCLWMFHLLEGIAVLACLCLLATQVIPVIYTIYQRQIVGSSTEDPDTHLASMDALSVSLRAYISLFCILFALVESNWPIPYIKKSMILQRYASRGFLYSFIALVSMQEATSERVRDIISNEGGGKAVSSTTHETDSATFWIAIFMLLSAWLMLGIGLLYLLMGLCCLKRLRDRLGQQEADARKAYRQSLRGN